MIIKLAIVLCSFVIFAESQPPWLSPLAIRQTFFLDERFGVFYEYKQVAPGKAEYILLHNFSPSPFVEVVKKPLPPHIANQLANPPNKNNQQNVKPEVHDSKTTLHPRASTENISPNVQSSNENIHIFQGPNASGIQGSDNRKPFTQNANNRDQIFFPQTPSLSNSRPPSSIPLSVYPNTLSVQKPNSNPQGGQRKPVSQQQSINKPENFDAVVNFAWDFFKQTNKNSLEQPNLVVCPLSTQLLLSYLALGSEGITKREIVETIKYDRPDGLNWLVDQMLRNPGGKELLISTALFSTIQASLNPKFKDFLDRSNVETIPTDFTKQEEFSRAYGAWVSKKTRNQFSNVRAAVDPTTKLVMASAVHFKGDWVYRLHPSVPENFSFGNDVTKVKMMKLLKKLPYGKIRDAEWIGLPYTSNDTMIIILPDEDVKINTFIQRMNMGELMNSINADTYGNITLTIPKFKIETKSSLNAPLQEMGIRRLFSFQSELPNIYSGQQDLGVSTMLQQASLEVNEEGTIATSLTALNVVALSFQVPVPDVDFRVNRPFIAMIFNRQFNFPYFVAKILRPDIN